MRKIKFRAWDKRKSKMYEVDTVSFNKKGCIEAVWTNGPDFADVLKDNRHGINPERNNLEQVKLMQYTGLKDIDGQEIFDGDILEYVEYKESLTEIINNDLPGTVDFRYLVEVGIFEEGLTTLGRDIEIDEFNYSNNDINEMAWSGKVIGNIYENTELLEESE